MFNRYTERNKKCREQESKRVSQIVNSIIINNSNYVKDNQLKKSQISENNFSFGVKDYLEIPGMEYHREIGIMGLDVTVVFKRAGRRTKLKKIKSGKIPRRQRISKEEIIKFMEDKFQTRFK